MISVWAPRHIDSRGDCVSLFWIFLIVKSISRLVIGCLSSQKMSAFKRIFQTFPFSLILTLSDKSESLLKINSLISLSAPLGKDKTGLIKLGWPTMPSVYSPPETAAKTVLWEKMFAVQNTKDKKNAKRETTNSNFSFFEKLLKIFIKKIIQPNSRPIREQKSRPKRWWR